MTTNKQIVVDAYASFAAGDVPAALAAMDEDIQWTESEGFVLAGTYVGPQAVLEGVFMRLGEIGDDFAVMPEQFVADGDTVVALGRYVWKHNPPGDPAAVKMAHVWTMAGGKAVAFQQYVDTVRVRELELTHRAMHATRRSRHFFWPARLQQTLAEGRGEFSGKPGTAASACA